MRSIAVLVIGGGAAGMMAALTARKNGAKVIVIEKLNKAGKKILATGNGKCNYTNYLQNADCYRGSQRDFAWNVIQKFDVNKTVEFFRDIGIMPTDREGYVYPASGQASSVRDNLERELLREGAELHTEEKVMDMKAHQSFKTGKTDGYTVTTDKDTYLAKKVIITTGGKAYPVHGSDGDGYVFAQKLGHTIVPPLPALTYCISSEKYIKDWAGVRTKGTVTAYREDNTVLASDSGELQFVATGISGIPVFQISRYIAKELSNGKKTYIIMDIFPKLSKEELQNELVRRKEKYANESVGTILEGMIHQKLIKALLKYANIDISKKAEKLAEKEIESLTFYMKNWRIPVSATGDFEKAQVTCGGVNTLEIDGDTMESKLAKGIYFAGEVVDVEGICGGYNLQWAWTSGYIAGKAASEA